MAVKTVAELISSAPNPAQLDTAAEWFSNVKEYAENAENGYIDWLAKVALLFCNDAGRVTEYTRHILSELKSINA